MSAEQTKGRIKTVIWLASLVAFMLAMSFAAVPLYDYFCRVTGWGGVTQVATSNDAEVLDRTIKVRFDASLERGMPWEFAPVAKEMEVKIGETGLAFYEAYNPTDKVVAGTASFNVFPYNTGPYFTKIDCFCFEMQVLEPGQRVQMPVTFYVDPEIVEDVEASQVVSITLSYTFHVTDLPEDQVGLVEPDGSALN